MSKAFLYNTPIESNNLLTYDAFCQTTEPTKKEGRIWIKSSIAMTRFEFGSTWSAGTVGMVAVNGTLGGANPTSSNSVIKVVSGYNNKIFYFTKITPSWCRQVQGSTGIWKDVEAYVCHSNTWIQFSKNWDGTLYNSGNTYSYLTGGWIDGGSKGTAYAGTGTVSINSSNIQLTINAYGSKYARTKNMVDLTSYKTLKATIKLASGTATTCPASIVALKNLDMSDYGFKGASASKYDIKASGTYSVDISKITGNYYIGIASDSAGNAATWQITKCWLE